MRDERPGCALCLHRCASDFVSIGARAFCPSCVRALGDFASQARWRPRVWQEAVPREADALAIAPLRREQDLNRRFNDELAELAESWRLTGEVFVDLTQRSENLAFDPATHLDLAIAYREMGIGEDALCEVAIALQYHEHLPRDRASYAVGMLLDPRWLRLSIDEALDLMRQELFAN